MPASLAEKLLLIFHSVTVLTISVLLKMDPQCPVVGKLGTGDVGAFERDVHTVA
jgi:hypothetical protein